MSVVGQKVERLIRRYGWIACLGVVAAGSVSLLASAILGRL